MVSFSNKHEEFFDFLIANAENFEKGAQLANEVMKDMSRISANMDEVSQLEHKADEINRQVVLKLSRVFITPIDREDFYNLTCNMENCVDSIHSTLMRVDLYHIKQTTPAAIQMSELLVTMSGEIKELFSLLKNIDRNEAELMSRAEHLSELESMADQIYRKEISRIFEGDMPVLDIIKWRDILNTMENVADRVERLGDTIKEVVMKYA